MNPTFLNCSLPDTFQISGWKTFSEPLADPLQSWLLQVEGGRQGGLGLSSQTTALPAGIFIHPVFKEGTQTSSTPTGFPGPPQLVDFWWDWVEYTCCPLEDLAVRSHIWVPDPRVVCGTIRLKNETSRRREITLEMRCRIPTIRSQVVFTVETFHGRQILTGNLLGQVVFSFLAGSGSALPVPSGISERITLESGGSAELRWVFASGSSRKTIHHYLRKILELNWAAEIARRKVDRERLISISTSRPKLDLVLAIAQKQARLILESLLLSAEEQSLDPPLLTPLQAWQLYQALVPPLPGDVDGLLRLTFPDAERTIQNGKSPSRAQARIPLGAELLWEIYQGGYPADRWCQYLSSAESELRKWFSPFRDRDGDGIPGLPGTVMDLGADNKQADDQPQPFHLNHSLEHPGLAGLLLNEICRLEELYLAANQAGGMDSWSEIKRNLARFITDSWLPSEGRFRTRNSFTHRSLNYSLPLPSLQDGWNVLGLDLEYPSQITLEISHLPRGDFRALGRIILHGLDWSGRYRVEEITPSSIRWKDGRGWTVTECLYSRLDTCLVAGLGRRVSIQLTTGASDNQEITTLLALWAEKTAPQNLAEILEHTLKNPRKYWSPSGLKSLASPAAGTVELPWNALVAQALIRQGDLQTAEELFTGWLEALQINLEVDGKSYPAWDSLTGRGRGQENWIGSLFPSALYLKLAGMEILADGKVLLERRADLAEKLIITCQAVNISLAADRIQVQRAGEEVQDLAGASEQAVQLFRFHSANFST